ncbi:MAG TPA: SDR family oxidoreductase [Limnochordales bacterium]
MDLGLRGKVAMVAAASQGLGYGAARVLAQEGARVAICSRRADAIEQAARRLREETGAEVVGSVCDVSRDQDLRRWVQEVEQRFGAVDVLVNNAGGPKAGNFFDMTDEDWYAAIELNFMSVVRLVRYVVPLMRRTGRGGSIITIVSYSLKEPIRGLVLSNAMRAALGGLSKSLADELGPEGIRVNAVVQGRFDTERLRSLDRLRAEREGVPVEQVVRRYTSLIPLGRYGQAEELGRVIAFLASEAASYVTGAAWVVDGGMLRALY